MRIEFSRMRRIDKYMDITIIYKQKEITLSVVVRNGKLLGDFRDGVMTAYVPYFNKNSDAVRKKHFEEIRNYVDQLESVIAELNKQP